MNAKLLVVAAVGGVVGVCVTQANAQSQGETARLEAGRSKEAYSQCLGNETTQALPRNMSGSDFTIYIKDRCLNERNQFWTKMAAYLNIQFPNVAMAVHFKEADGAITKAIEDAASNYADLKTKGR